MIPPKEALKYALLETIDNIKFFIEIIPLLLILVVFPVGLYIGYIWVVIKLIIGKYFLFVFLLILTLIIFTMFYLKLFDFLYKNA